MIYLFLILHLISNIHASHFRGGIIVWKPLIQNETMAIIDVTIKLGWRRNYTTLCTQSHIIGRNLSLGGNTGFVVTPGTLLDPYNGVYCSDFSAIENWSYGDASYRVKYDYPYTNKTYELVYTGSDWITLLNGGSYLAWNLISKVNLDIRNSTGRINQSPIASMSPLVKIKAGCYKEVGIPILDGDGDVIRCRWSNGAECGTSCSLPTYVELDEKNCKVKFNLTNSVGYYAVRLQIEDFEDENSTTPLSSIPLEFLVYAYTSNNCSSIDPIFLNPTKPDKTCVSVPSNNSYNDIIIVNSNEFNVSLNEVQTVSPTGLIKSPIYINPNNTSIGYVNVSWTPNTKGMSIFCFIGVTASFSTTEQRCVSLATGYSPPMPLSNSLNPVGVVSSNQTEWVVSADQNLERPKNHSYIKFFEKGKLNHAYQVDVLDTVNVLIEKKQLIFKTTQFLKTEKYYYITFDSGVFTTNIGCGMSNDEITSPDFWKFYVGDCYNVKNCSGNGVCIDVNECQCNNGWTGKFCETKIYESCTSKKSCYEFNCLAGILFAIICALVFVLFFTFVFIVYKKKRESAKVVQMEPSNQPNQQ